MATAIDAFSADEKLKQRAPILLLERVERGEDGAEHGDDDDEHAEAGGDARVAGRAAHSSRPRLKP